MQVIFAITLFVLFLFFISAPSVIFDAAQNAVYLWAHTVVPSMLPFFILNALLNRIGGIELIGRILRRPVEKLWKLPGEAAFILASGYSTGVPVSASLIAELRKKEILSRDEGNRLLAFSANVSPAFLLSAVSVSMLGNEAAGPVLAMIHYGTNLGLMLILCVFSRTREPSSHRRQPVGELKPPTMEALTDAVFQSLRTIFLIGGMILCFFILIAVIHHIRLIPFLTTTFHVSPEAAQGINGLFCGFLEITAGASEITRCDLPFSKQCALLSAIMAFGGLSAAMQIASVIRETDLSLGFYLKYKLLQAGAAWVIAQKVPGLTEGAFAPVSEMPSPIHSLQGEILSPETGSCILFLCLLLAFLICRQLLSERRR